MHQITIGIDEAGRGPVFGPMVVAGAVNITDWHLASIKDSKQIKNENTRRTIASEIRRNMVWAVGEISVEAINRFGTLVSLKHAGEKVMNQLIVDVRQLFPDASIEVIFDGRDHKGRTENGVVIRSEEKADAKYFCVSAASIVAKVHHDDRIEEIMKSHPMYAHFDLIQNKGYPTQAHKAALRIHGTTDQHRVKACRTFLADNASNGTQLTPPAQEIR